MLERSPALAECARRALGSAGVTMDEVEGLDLYACFPSSVEVARDSFGIAVDDPRPLTLTGGLPYHGGPGEQLRHPLHRQHPAVAARRPRRACPGARQRLLPDQALRRALLPAGARRGAPASPQAPGARGRHGRGIGGGAEGGERRHRHDRGLHRALRPRTWSTGGRSASSTSGVVAPSPWPTRHSRRPSSRATVSGHG